jgi:uncharacterized protein YbdZ (MbtH family)
MNGSAERGRDIVRHSNGALAPWSGAVELPSGWTVVRRGLATKEQALRVMERMRCMEEARESVR